MAVCAWFCTNIVGILMAQRDPHGLLHVEYTQPGGNPRPVRMPSPTCMEPTAAYPLRDSSRSFVRIHIFVEVCLRMMYARWLLTRGTRRHPTAYT